MKKRLNIPLLLGIVLILISLCFVGFSLIKNHTENQNAQKIVSEIVAFLPPITPGSTEERFDNSCRHFSYTGRIIWLFWKSPVKTSACR